MFPDDHATSNNLVYADTYARGNKDSALFIVLVLPQGATNVFCLVLCDTQSVPWAS